MSFERIEKKFSAEQRQGIVNQLKSARAFEKSPARYNTIRNLREYFIRLHGFQNLFSYIKSLPCKKVLDIGTGEGIAIAELSKLSMTEGLDFELTALKNVPNLRKNFSKEKIHITGVETLRGIAPLSVACILAVNSVAYSSDPGLAVQQMDEVLIPGGVVKASFYIKSNAPKRYASNLFFQGPRDFMYAFKRLGYDVESDLFGEGDTQVVVAVKPGNHNALSAFKLLYNENLNFKEIKKDD